MASFLDRISNRSEVARRSTVFPQGVELCLLGIPTFEWGKDGIPVNRLACLRGRTSMARIGLSLNGPGGPDGPDG